MQVEPERVRSVGGRVPEVDPGVGLVRTLVGSERMSRWIRKNEPPTGRGSATTCGLILRSAGANAEMKRSAGSFTSRS
jgi:hypothetical protein